MKKTAVIYWSGTGNTEAMANAVLEGMTAAGADAKLLTVDQVNTAELNGYEGRFFYSHFLCLKNHSNPATSSMLAAMITG